MTRKFRSNRMDSFWENWKKSKNGCFLVVFWLFSAMFLTSQGYDFVANAQIEFQYGVKWLENFVRIEWTVFEKIEKSPKMAVFCRFLAIFGYVSHIPVIRFCCQCTNRIPIWRKMTRKFRSNRMDSFWENWKKSKNGCFLVVFWLFSAMFLTSQSYDFIANAQIEFQYGVKWLENFVRIEWTVFEKIEKSPKMAVFWSFSGYFRLCFSHPSHTILMSLRTQEHLSVYNDCANLYWSHMDSFWEIRIFHWKVGRKKRPDCISLQFFPTPEK